MNKYKNLLQYSLVCLIFVFQSCATAPINLTIAKDEVIKYHESGRYDKETAKIIDAAIDKFNNIKAGKNDAVIFDIDETALSSYEYRKKFDFGYVPEIWDKWVNKAKAPAIKEVKRLYDLLVSRDFKIIFLTGRKDYMYKATYQNLVDQGYTKFDTLIVRSSNEYKITALVYKSQKRTELVKKGYNIAGDVGDQLSDLEGPYHGIQVKIPNYQYLIK
ncbi:MAG: HAD family acid phosphatase [Ignavibacteriaceae bacterium]|jgi:acid phosphatase